MTATERPARARTRRPKMPPPPPHEPAGDFRAPEPQIGMVCHCGAALTRVSNGTENPTFLDWHVVDEQGRTTIDVTPTFRFDTGDEVIEIDMHDDDAWERLVKVDPALYSRLKASLSLAYDSFTHYHNEVPGSGERVGEHRPPPECHGQPMWAAPDGWRCRTAMGDAALVPYSG